jgi:hypothetical protein
MSLNKLNRIFDFYITAINDRALIFCNITIHKFLIEKRFCKVRPRIRDFLEKNPLLIEMFKFFRRDLFIGNSNV